MQPTEEKPVSEVFITHVKPGKYDLYQKWAAKIRKIEADFPGYKGVYTQSPAANDPNSWVTILSFDTAENLDNWLTSKKRQEIIKESGVFVENYEGHLMTDPFFGWFSSFDARKKASTIIKEAMLILLVLFPIVMLELKFLNPITNGLNLSVATFIGNTISVALITWPAMPVCLYFLGWWLKAKTIFENILGTLIVIALYVISILIFYW